jgi:hypothetical protein
MRCMLMRNTPIRCTPMRCTVHAHEIHAHEMYESEIFDFVLKHPSPYAGPREGVGPTVRMSRRTYRPVRSILRTPGTMLARGGCTTNSAGISADHRRRRASSCDLLVAIGTYIYAL